MKAFIKATALACVIIAYNNFYLAFRLDTNSDEAAESIIIELEKEEIKDEAAESIIIELEKEEIKDEAAESIIIELEKEETNSVESYDSVLYERQLHEALTPLPESQSKTGFYTKQFMAGLCNQYGRFVGTILLARTTNGFDQIINESINWKDTYGTDATILTSKLWDLVHWNSFYPMLPRFVRYEKETHKDLISAPSSFKIDGKNYTHPTVKYNVSEGHNIWNSSLSISPPPFGQFPNQGENQYRQLTTSINNGRAKYDRKLSLKMYETILKGALRPHPFLQAIVDQTASKFGGLNDEGYMVIHMRVEPDMNKQMNCGHKKVWYVDNITDMVYKQYPKPPVQTVLLVFARALIEAMEIDAKKSERGLSHHQKVNRHNLNEINDLLDNGMWGGKVKVVEAGSAIVEEAGNPFYKYYSNIAGGIVNFFLAIQSKILVGTEVSTWSTLSINTRFYRGIKENYFYRPEGLHWVTPPNVTKPHKFVC
eukprot:scaffold2184_cov266-Chaetoceros_neogracile.AAC.31